MVSLLSSNEVCHASGCTFRQLDHWTRQDLILCEVPARGSGTQRKYTPDEALLVWVATVWSEAVGGASLPPKVLAPLREGIRLRWSNVLVTMTPGVQVVFDLDLGRFTMQSNLKLHA